MSNFEDWTRALSELFEDTLEVTDQVVQATVEVVNTLTDDLERHLSVALDQMADDLQQTIAPIEGALEEEMERLAVEIADVVTPVVIPLVNDLEQWLSAIAQPLTSTVDPLMNHHRPCIGCRFYHGQTYGDAMLVCGLHPYGPTTDTCQDWEAIWKSESASRSG